MTLGKRLATLARRKIPRRSFRAISTRFREGERYRAEDIGGSTLNNFDSILFAANSRRLPYRARYLLNRSDFGLF